ncbi:MAG: peptidase U62 [Proteobacteria bacterium]|nr:MAG: peptidase U62 [Pseudomonadota bacterium]PIE18852.1 MAG: peptidase U62 [Pseudomonadota bacterium]
MSETPTREIGGELEELANAVVRRALDGGADEVALSVGRSQFVEARRRQGKIERLRASTSRGLSLALFADKRFSTHATSVLQRPALERFVDEALAMTRHLHKDPFRGLADPALYGPAECADLELRDPDYEVMTMDQRLELLERLEAAAQQERAADRAGGGSRPELVSVATGVVTQRSASLQLHSNGFRGARSSTVFSLGSSVTVRGEGERRPSDHAWAARCRRADLPDVAEVGQEACRRALGRVGARKIESGRMALVVENRAASRLLGALLAPLSGSSLQQKRSCLEGKLGESIASPLLNVVDDPFIRGGLGSRTYDGDGLAARRRSIIEAGVLREYLIDVYYGRKLDLQPTGAGTSNLTLEGGEGDLMALLAPVQRGVLVTSFLGGNANPATGDFSFGIVGQRIDSGKLTQPVGEMNITGNTCELWRRLEAVAADAYADSAWRLPSLRFGDVQFSGA